MSSADLPVEIIFAILQHIYYKYSYSSRPSLLRSRNPDYETLSACSLISSVWRIPAQSLLFLHVTEDAAPKLWLTAQKFTALGMRDTWASLMEHTRILEMLLIADTSLQTFTALMEQCPNLYELHVLGSGIISLRPVLTDLQKSVYPYRLRALRIGRCSVQSPILYELLDFFPTVQSLTVEVEIAVLPPSIPTKIQLYELVMFRTLSTEICSWLLSNSHESLRILEMRDLPSADLSRLLEGYGHGLDSFRIMKYNFNTGKIVSSCTRLKELVILGIPSVPPFSAQSLPLTLEHFSLVHHHSDPSVGIAEVMMLVKKLSGLKLLTSDVKLEEDPMYGVLHDVCVHKGIEVETSKFGYWPNEEPVRTGSFPRIRSISNFRYMNQDF